MDLQVTAPQDVEMTTLLGLNLENFSGCWK